MLPRTNSPLLRQQHRPARRCLRALILCCAVVQARQAVAAADTPGEAEHPARAAALAAVATLRRAFDPAAVATVDSLRPLLYRGRDTLEVKGRTGGGEAPAAVRDIALFDLAAGRVCSFVYFPHASARKAGEAIISLSEVSSRADAHLRTVLPGTNLALEGIQRYRASGEDSVYYEAGYAPRGDGLLFFQPPVRLLLDASTGRLFRLDLEPEWEQPPPAPASRISRQAAERIAAVVLGRRDLTQVFGPGATLGKLSGAELFYVVPNDWLGFFDPFAHPGVRAAWVVPFGTQGEVPYAGNALFVDAASGRVVGGAPGAPVPVR